MSTSTGTRRRISPLLIGLGVLLLAVGLPFIWWTASPLFINTRVDEAFPTVAPTVAAQATVAPVPTAAAPTAAPTAAPAAAPAAAPTADATTEPTTAPAPTSAPTAEPTAPAPTAAPAGPVALASGSFTFIDQLHWAEGSAVIYQLEDGSRVLRLENFTAQNGPDLWVGLAGHGTPRSSAELHDTGAGYFELERLKANQGNQNYIIPADLDLSAFNSVVIYCKAFSVVFSTAELLS